MPHLRERPSKYAPLQRDDTTCSPKSETPQEHDRPDKQARQIPKKAEQVEPEPEPETLVDAEETERKLSGSQRSMRNTINQGGRSGTAQNVATALHQTVSIRKRLDEVRKLADQIMSLRAAHRIGQASMEDHKYDRLLDELYQVDQDEHSLRVREGSPFVRVLQGGQGKVEALVPFQYGQKAAVLSEDTQSGLTLVHIWDLETGRHLQTLDQGTAPEFSYTAIVIYESATGGCEHAVTAKNNGVIQVWDVSPEGSPQGWRLLHSYEAPGKVTMTSVKVCAGGRFAVMKSSSTREGEPAVWLLDLGMVPTGRETEFEGFEGLSQTPSETPEKVRAISAFEQEIQMMAPTAKLAPHAFAVSCSRRHNEQVKIWMVWDGTQRFPLGKKPTLTLKHNDTVPFCLPYSQGRRLISCSSDWHLRIWNVELRYTTCTGTRTCTDGIEPVATGSHREDGMPSWLLEQPLALLVGHTGKVNSCDILSGGSQAMSCSEDGSVRVWNILPVSATSNRMHTIEVEATQILLADSATADDESLKGNGEKWTAKDDTTLRRRCREKDDNLKEAIGTLQKLDFRFREKDEEEITNRFNVLNRRAVRRCVILEESGQVVTAYNDGTLKVFDLADGHCAWTLRGHTKAVVRLSWLGAGQRVLSGSADGTVRMWDLASRTRVRALVRFVDSADESGALRTRLQGLESAGTGIINKGFRLFADGRCAISAHKDPGGSRFSLRIWDISMRCFRQALSHPEGEVTAFTVSSDGLWALSFANQNMYRWDLQSDGSGSFCKTPKITPLAELLRASQQVQQVLHCELFNGDQRMLVVHGPPTNSKREVSIWKVEPVASIVALDVQYAKKSNAGVFGQGFLSEDFMHSDPYDTAVTPSAKPVVFEVGFGTGDWRVLSAVQPRRAQRLSQSVTIQLAMWTARDPEKYQLERRKVMWLDTRKTGHTETIVSTAVFSGGYRALSCSSDSTMRLWDLSDKAFGERQLLCLHCESVVRYCIAMDGAQDSGLDNKSEDMCHLKSSILEGYQRVLGCLDDGTIRVWKLPMANNREKWRNSNVAKRFELVASRGRYSEPDDADPKNEKSIAGKNESQVVCLFASSISSATQRLNYAGPRPIEGVQVICGRKDGRVSSIDMSRVESDMPCATSLWEEFQRPVPPEESKQLLIETVQEHPHVLYQPDRGQHNMTLVHRLSGEDNGYQILQTICNSVQNAPRKGHLITSSVDSLLTRAGKYRSVDLQAELLSLGVPPIYERILLHFKLDSPSTWRSPREKKRFADILDDSKEWSKLLEQNGIAKNHANVRHQNVLKDWFEKKRGKVHAERSALAVAIAARNEDCVQLLLDNYADSGEVLGKPWARDRFVAQDILAQTLEVYPAKGAAFIMQLKLCKTEIVSPNSRCKIDASGTVRSSESVVPQDPLSARPWWDGIIEAMWVETRAGQVGLLEGFRHLDGAWGKPVMSKVVSIYGAPSSGKLSGGTAAGGEGVCGFWTRTTSELPFSRLLQAVVNYAENEGSPEIFNAPSICAIVQHKWDGNAGAKQMSCKQLFWFICIAYFLHALCFTGVVLFFSGSVSDTTGFGHYRSDPVYADIAWIFWGVACLYNAVLFKGEVHQVLQDGVLVYFTDRWNLLDLFANVSTAIALYMIYFDCDEQSAAAKCYCDHDCSHAVQAGAMLCTWYKILYFLRGFEYTGFVVNMLSQIINDMGNFVIVLAIILFAFSNAFYLLLPYDDLSGDQFARTPVDALVQVYAMMLGGFDLTPFRNSPSPTLAVCVFILFMGIVAVVLLNAVIAIMSNTFDRVNDQRESAGLLEKAKVVLEIEGLMNCTSDKKRHRTKRRHQFVDVLRLLFTQPIQHYVPSASATSAKPVQFLHVLTDDRQEQTQDVGPIDTQPARESSTMLSEESGDLMSRSLSRTTSSASDASRWRVMSTISTDGMQGVTEHEREEEAHRIRAGGTATSLSSASPEWSTRQILRKLDHLQASIPTAASLLAEIREGDASTSNREADEGEDELTLSAAFVDDLAEWVTDDLQLTVPEIVERDHDVKAVVRNHIGAIVFNVKDGHLHHVRQDSPETTPRTPARLSAQKHERPAPQHDGESRRMSTAKRSQRKEPTQGTSHPSEPVTPQNLQAAFGAEAQQQQERAAAAEVAEAAAEAGQGHAGPAVKPDPEVKVEVPGAEEQAGPSLPPEMSANQLRLAQQREIDDY